MAFDDEKTKYVAALILFEFGSPTRMRSCFTDSPCFADYRGEIMKKIWNVGTHYQENKFYYYETTSGLCCPFDCTEEG